MKLCVDDRPSSPCEGQMSGWLDGVSRALCSLLAAIFLLAALIAPARAQQPPPADGGTLGKAKAANSLRWGADQEGGAPYIYPGEENQEVLIGFEVDMAEKMSAYMGIKVDFQQSQWDALPSMLQANKVDFIMNGYEWMPERVAAMETSIPYYVYALQLMVAKNGEVKSWEDMKKLKADGDKWHIGVLSGSAAEEYMTDFKDNQGGQIELASYDGVTDSMREVETGKLDATLQDTPIASYYIKEFPGLTFLGEAVAPGYYVIYARQGDRELIARINEAIIVLFRNGDLQKIYEKYGMWNKEQEELKAIIENGKFYGYLSAVATETQTQPGDTVTAAEVAESEEKGKGEKVREFAELLTASAGMTLLLSFISFPLAVTFGLLIAIGRLYGPLWVRVPLATYVELLRGTPLMLQLYFIFYFLPEVGINIPAFATAIIGLSVNYSAYESEIYRAGLQAIPIGQMEAAQSLGMTRGQAIQRIIVPQAVRIVIPPVVNDFIAMFKDTSVCSVVTIVELTKRFSILSRNNVQSLVELTLLTGLLYLLMSYPMSLIASRLEKRLAREAA